jgi:hypothetical protein
MRSAQEAPPAPNISRISMQARKFLKLVIAVLDSYGQQACESGWIENVMINLQQQGCCHDLHLETLIQMMAILLFFVYRCQTLWRPCNNTSWLKQGFDSPLLAGPGS